APSTPSCSAGPPRSPTRSSAATSISPAAARWWPAACPTRPTPACPTSGLYLASDDTAKTVDAAVANGGQVHVPPMAVGELGTMAVLGDPGGAAVGVWQPGLHRGFGVVREAGAPSWFELHTRDYEKVVAFYRN